MPKVDIRHLSRLTSPRQHHRTRMSICSTFVPDRLMGPGCPRLALMMKAPSSSMHEQSPVHSYFVTNDLEQWLSGVQPGPVMLHVDMDYFNNRFDGNSWWNRNNSPETQDIEKILTRIDQVFAALRIFRLGPNIADCAIAVSPGFFPGEFWEQSVGRVLSRMGEINIPGSK